MPEDMTFRTMTPGDVDDASRLVIEVFKAAIAPLYSAEGVQEFLAYASPEAMAKRSGEDQFALLALDRAGIVGVAEIRDNNHVAMFFVSSRLQRTGVGRELLRRAIDICVRERPGLVSISVNASPNAVAAYERLGFQPTTAGADRKWHPIHADGPTAQSAGPRGDMPQLDFRAAGASR